MNHIKSRKHPHPLRPGLLGCASAALATLAMPLALRAQEVQEKPKPAAPAPEKASQELPEIKVKSRREVPYKADTTSSPKQTQPLVDTPKTIQVVKKELIQEQGASTLMEALRNTPGITMQLGENGSTSAGDTFQMRGFSTQSSTFVDGLRDLGAVTRDVFNLDQVEVVKGPAGAETGRGSSSGYINLVSKLPTLDAFSEGYLTAGTAGRKRATADLNQPIGDHGAFRLNVMGQDGGVDGRDVVANKGTGIAPSFAYGLGTPMRVFLYSQHLKQTNIPDGGIPTIGMEGFYNVTPAIDAGARVDAKNFYGSRQDVERITSNLFSTRIEMDLSRGTTLRSLTRYGQTHMDRVLTGIQNIAAPNVDDPSTWTLSRSRQRLDQTNEVLANQTSLNTGFDTGGIWHDLAAGIELIYERQLTLGTGTTAQTIRGVMYPAINLPVANLYNPNPDDGLGVPYLTGVDSEGRTLTLAGYLFNTATLNDSWKLTAGLRFERYSLSSSSGTIVTATNLPTFPGYAIGGVVPSELKDADNLLSWNLGVVFKPAANGTIYAAAANSLTPPGGNNFALSATAGNQANTTMEPQSTSNVELGTKWELLNKRLNLSAAIYRSENDNQVSQDPIGGSFRQFGKTRVEGLELTVVGQLTNFWQVTAGFSKMRAKQLDQISRNATSGVITETEGVRWSPDLSATLWTSYTTHGLTVGIGGRYLSKQERVITASTDLATQNMPSIPSSLVADLMAAYQVTKAFKVQLNVGNLFDKDYISSLNNSGARMRLGAPRSAALTASVRF